MKPGVFFVSGMAKSGTSWMMNMLNLLPGVVCAGEGRFFSSGLDDVPSLYDSIESAIAPWHDYVAHRKGGWIGLDDAIRTIDKLNYLPSDAILSSRRELTILLVEAAVRGLMLESTAASAPGTRLVGDKTPVFAPEELQRLVDSIPEAKVLFMRREVKDYLVSLLFHFWRSVRDGRPDRYMSGLDVDDFLRIQEYRDAEHRDDLPFVSDETAERLATNWARANQLAARLEYERPGAVRVIDYEFLMTNPNETMSAVAAFLGVSVSDEAIAQVVDETSIAAVRGGSNPSLKQHIRSGKPGDWVKYLSEHVGQTIDSTVAGVEAWYSDSP